MDEGTLVTVVVGGFAIALGILVLLFTKQLVAASERTRVTEGTGKSRPAAGWQGFSTLITRVAGVFFVVVGILLLANVLHLR